jgi:hypothetical protein
MSTPTCIHHSGDVNSCWSVPFTLPRRSPLHFGIDALLIILIRDTSNPSKFDIVLDYGVSVVAYIWRALQLGIKSYLDTKDGFAAKDLEVQDDPQLT